MKNRKTYVSALATRYASLAMQTIFGDEKKFGTWRKVWLGIAEICHSLGVKAIVEEGLVEMRAHLDLTENSFLVAEEEEALRRHDLMAHVHAYGLAAPTAKPFIHFGCTSCDVTDNADEIIYREALRLITKRLAALLRKMGRVAKSYRDLPVLGATHGQAAQPTTFGKRVAMWMAPLVQELREIERFIDEMPIRGIQGTVGTQASFMEIFDGDETKVIDMNTQFAARFDFRETDIATGQTYSRVRDYKPLNRLAELSSQVHKVACDIRLLARAEEVAEPQEEGQIGSSAMPYKENPMLDERVDSLARLPRVHANAMGETASQQWLERSLDDSAIRRISMAESFLAVDTILSIMTSVFANLVIFPKVIEKNLREKLPFLATEAIIAEVVKRGGDRQIAHERIRIHSREVKRRMREEGLANDLLGRLATDPVFANIASDLPSICDPTRFTGRAASQVNELLAARLVPALANYPESEENTEKPKV